MYSSNNNPNRDLIPISEQFAQVLESDIQDYVESLRQLDTPVIAEELYNSRQRMLSENVIQQAEQVQGLGSMVAVDGGNNVLNVGLGTQCFVVSVLYSLRQNYDVRISMERLTFEQEDSTALMYGVRNAMEVRDIYDAHETESFCIVDNSWVSLLQNVNRVLVNYRNSNDNDKEILEQFLKPMLSRNGDFVNIVRHPRNIAISKGGVSRFYCKEYNRNLNLLDKVFLLGVLQSGEYTEPMPLSAAESGAGQLNVHTDDVFESKNAIKVIYNATLTSTGVDCICSTYFRPHAWSPVKRIEFNRELLRNGRRLFYQMLATVKDSMIVPTIYEPLEQFLVDQIVKRHTGRLPSLYQTIGVANIRDFNSNLATQLVRGFRT